MKYRYWEIFLGVKIFKDGPTLVLRPQSLESLNNDFVFFKNISVNIAENK